MVMSGAAVGADVAVDIAKQGGARQGLEQWRGDVSWVMLQCWVMLGLSIAVLGVACMVMLPF